MNSCWVLIYSSWVERDNCWQVDKLHSVGAFTPMRFDLTQQISVGRAYVHCPLTPLRHVAYEFEWSYNGFSMLNFMRISFAIQFRLKIQPEVSMYHIAVESPWCVYGMVGFSHPVWHSPLTLWSRGTNWYTTVLPLHLLIIKLHHVNDWILILNWWPWKRSNSVKKPLEKKRCKYMYIILSSFIEHISLT